VGVADSSGTAAHPEGLSLTELLAAKQRGGVADLPAVGRSGMSALELVETTPADVILEATPVNLRTGQPGLDVVRAGLRRGRAVVLANKGPLALAYGELAGLSDLGDPLAPALRFSACVGGAMPTITLGSRVLAGARVLKVEAILNGTTQFILREIEAGRSFKNALAEAQRQGLAETDSSLDVDGWDAAAKLAIVANAVLGQPATIRDVEVEGIGGVTPELLASASARGERVVLLCLAEPVGGEGNRFLLRVAPTPLPLAHPLARLDAAEMGVVYHTDIAGRATAISLERDPVPTASAMLRDLLDVVGALPN
jgi:homoserine dehydrogenase